ncbi:MAG TPA: hypothetical protein VGE09_03160 [Pseudoxanthomonas sp.]
MSAMVDLEQFRAPVQEWKDQVLLPRWYHDRDAARHDEADRLLAIIDGAKAAAPPATSGLVEARTLYVDLDGVMADFDGAFPQVFGLDHRSLADDEMWLHINGHPSFFRDLPPMAGAIEFFRSIEHLNPVILTACPKSNYAHVAAQKRAWVREHLSATCWVLPVLGGRHKPLFMHRSGDVLIDDFGKNCAAWIDAGGIAIKHDGDWTSTRASLDAALATHNARGAAAQGAGS